MTAPISNEPTTTRLHHYAGHYSQPQALRRHFREITRPTRGFRRPIREKVRPTRALHRVIREKVRPARLKTAFFGHFGLAGRTFSRSRTHQAAQGELFRAHAHIKPRRANFFAHKTQPRGDDATNDTTATTDAGQHETTITTTHP